MIDLVRGSRITVSRQSTSEDNGYVRIDNKEQGQMLLLSAPAWLELCEIVRAIGTIA